MSAEEKNESSNKQENTGCSFTHLLKKEPLDCNPEGLAGEGESCCFSPSRTVNESPPTEALPLSVVGNISGADGRVDFISWIYSLSTSLADLDHFRDALQPHAVECFDETLKICNNKCTALLNFAKRRIASPLEQSTDSRDVDNESNDPEAAATNQQKRIEEMIQGAWFYKIGKTALLHRRKITKIYMWLSSDCKEIHYASSPVKPGQTYPFGLVTLPLTSVRSLLFGESATAAHIYHEVKVTNPENRKPNNVVTPIHAPYLCLTLLLNKQKRLDLVALTEEDMLRWLTGLSRLVPYTPATFFYSQRELQIKLEALKAIHMSFMDSVAEVCKIGEAENKKNEDSAKRFSRQSVDLASLQKPEHSKLEALGQKDFSGEKFLEERESEKKFVEARSFHSNFGSNNGSREFRNHCEKGVDIKDTTTNIIESDEQVVGNIVHKEEKGVHLENCSSDEAENSTPSPEVVQKDKSKNLEKIGESIELKSANTTDNDESITAVSEDRKLEERNDTKNISEKDLLVEKDSNQT